MITRKLIDTVAARMVDSQRQAVRSALRSGSKVVSCGRYYVGGPLVLTVETPVEWRKLEAFRNSETINCVIPAEKEAATLAWVANR